MRLLTLLLLLTLSGCASWLPKFSAPAEDTSASAETTDKSYQPADPEFYKRAYEQGVRDTLQEYKGSYARARTIRLRAATGAGSRCPGAHYRRDVLPGTQTKSHRAAGALGAGKQRPCPRCNSP